MTAQDGHEHSASRDPEHRRPVHSALFHVSVESLTAYEVTRSSPEVYSKWSLTAAFVLRSNHEEAC